LLLALIAVAAVVHASADDHQVQSALRRALDKKIVVLRGFYAGQSLRFDSSGNPIGEARSGPWTADGVLQVTRVSMKGDHIVIRGRRLLNTFDSKRCQFTNVFTGMQVEIEVGLGSASPGADQALDTVDKVVARDARELVNMVPEWWKPWVRGISWVDKQGHRHCGAPEEQQAESAAGTQEPHGDKRSGRPSFTESDGTQVFKVGGGIVPPQVLSAPDPPYSEVARQAKVQGTTLLQVVLNDRGEPTTIRIARPIGAGLDDRAVEAVKAWRFKPATRNGNPVAVQIDVEVNFRLY
jgi:TonB family protein